MDDETKNLIKEQYAKLPQTLQQAIQSADLHDQITKIGTKNQLHIDQIGVLEDEVSMLMMGFTEPIEFASALQEHIHVDAVLAQKIATDVNQEILLPIRDRMENGITEIKNPPTVTAAPAVPEKSVIMPSSVVVPKPPAPPATPVTPASIAPQSGISVPLDMQINAPLVKPEISAPITKPQVTAPAPEIDVMFNEPTISVPKKVETPATLLTGSGQAATSAPAVPNVTAKVEPPKPAPIYKADPYREPIE